MKIGIAQPFHPPPRHAQHLDAAFLAREAERVGFESIWYGEHPFRVVNPTGGSSELHGAKAPLVIDPLIALARASAATTEIRLGTAVLLAIEHNPLLLAKQIATLDLYSGGRFILGVGSGWAKDEVEIMGGDFEHRGAQTREAILAMKELWTKRQAEFHGTYYDFPLVTCFPWPAQQPHPPVLLGGASRNVLRRVVACADGWFPSGLPVPEFQERLADLHAMAREAGRDTASIRISVLMVHDGDSGEREQVDRYEGLGVERVVMLSRLNFNTEGDAITSLERIGEQFLR